ncbi:MAG: hypothetical protein M1827_005296 [Pycnora praestabilis]|nr:MAG: hypothetical protein M1827_005296 [Pycnora praestabilis]
MLRLRPSQIELTPSDIASANQRSRERRAIRAAVRSRSSRPNPQLSYANAAETSTRIPYDFPQPPTFTRHSQNDIISDQPLTQAAAAFWSSLRNHAVGSLANHEEIPSGLPNSGTEEESNQEDDDTPVTDSEDNYSQKSLEGNLPTQEYGSEDEVPYSGLQVGGSSNLTYRSSIPSSRAAQQLISKYVDRQGQAEESSGYSFHNTQLEYSDSPRSPADVEDEIQEVTRRVSDQMQLDGAPNSDYTYEPHDGVFSAPKEERVGSSPTFIPDPESTLPILPRSVSVHHRFQKSALPGSPLVHSQAAVSSSPDKGVQSHSSVKANVAEGPSFLARPARRPRKSYKHRSESDPFEESEADEINGHGIADTRPHEKSLPSPSYDINQGASPLPETLGYHQNFSTLHHSFPDGEFEQYYSPYYVFSHHSSPTLPPPFSVTPRRVSSGFRHSNSVSPSLHDKVSGPPTELEAIQFAHQSAQHEQPNPLSPHQPPSEQRLSELRRAIELLSQDRKSSPIGTRSRGPILNPKASPFVSHPSTPNKRAPRHFTPSPSPPPPFTPHRSVRVYNDTLPAWSQPQTPANLRRHARDAAFTAPARTQLPRPVPRTPTTRRIRGRSDSPIDNRWDSEENDVDMEYERAFRARERTEWELREVATGGLDPLVETPPRGDRWTMTGGRWTLA